MLKLSISPSMIETYRKFHTEEYGGFITDEAVVIAVKRETQWSNEMQFGTAFHEIIENGHEKYYDEISGLYHISTNGKEGEVVLPLSSIQEAIKFRSEHPNMIYEVPIQHTINIRDFEVRFKMKIDGLEGDVIHEQKTSKRFSGYEFYEKSLQHKLYMLATGSNLAVYNVFTYTQKQGYPIIVTAHNPIKIPRHESLENDVMYWLDMFLSFCEDKNIMEFVTLEHYQNRFSSDIPDIN